MAKASRTVNDLSKAMSVQPGGIERNARQPSADELMWLNFETKVRNIMRGMLEPVVDISTKDREGMLILEENFNGLDDRLARLEEAIFNVAVNGEETLFEKMAKKIKAHVSWTKTEIKAIQDK